MRPIWIAPFEEKSSSRRSELLDCARDENGVSDEMGEETYYKQGRHEIKQYCSCIITTYI